MKKELLILFAVFLTALSALAENCILYTSSDGNVVVPNYTNVFGANIISNTYVDGQGKILFDGELTQIGNRAFYHCQNLAEITSMNTTPPSAINDSFNFVPTSTFVLKVPASAVELYRAATGWSSFKHIEEIRILLVDGEVYDEVEDTDGVCLQYQRNFASTNWQSLYVPFSMNISEISDYFDVAKFYGVHQYDNDGTVDETLVEYIIQTSGNTVPNRPYLIRPKQTGEVTINFSQRELAAAEHASVDCSTTESLFTITGVYSPQTVEAGQYVMYQGGFVHATGSTLQPGRIYMTVTPRDSYSANPSTSPQQIGVRIIGEDGEETAVERIEADSANGKIYNLQGQIVGEDYKGIVIVNGKKMLKR